MVIADVMRTRCYCQKQRRSIAKNPLSMGMKYPPGTKKKANSPPRAGPLTLPSRFSTPMVALDRIISPQDHCVMPCSY